MTIDDERVRFYLRHREQIEQWAALRSEAATAVDNWLLGLRADVDALMVELGSDVDVCVRDQPDATFPGFLLYRRAWSVKDADAPQPSIGLEWVRGRTTLHGSAAPYVGLRSLRETPLGTALRSRVDFKRCRAERKDVLGSNWAAYRYVLPVEPFPDNDTAYRGTLLEALRAVWSDYAPIVDAAIVGPGD